MVSVRHDNAGWANPVPTWISGIYLKDVGVIIAGLFGIGLISGSARPRAMLAGERVEEAGSAPVAVVEVTRVHALGNSCTMLTVLMQA